ARAAEARELRLAPDAREPAGLGLGARERRRRREPRARRVELHGRARDRREALERAARRGSRPVGRDQPVGTAVAPGGGGVLLEEARELARAELDDDARELTRVDHLEALPVARAVLGENAVHVLERRERGPRRAQGLVAVDGVAGRAVEVEVRADPDAVVVGELPVLDAARLDVVGDATAL